MTISWQGKYFPVKLMRVQQNCHPDRSSERSVVEGPVVLSPQIL